MHEHEDHIHDGEVTHEHTHTHTHEHSHPHAHSHASEGGTPSQTVALLRYMLEHNRSHAAEAQALIPKLAAEGKADAAMMIESGVNSYKDGNDWLAAALKKLEEADT